MALRCVRVATVTLLFISFALLMGQPTAHAQTPTPTPKPGHGPLSLEPHSAPVAGCIAKCRKQATDVAFFLACQALCPRGPKPTEEHNTRKPTNTARSTRTPGRPPCCECPPISSNTSPFCFKPSFDCSEGAGCTAFPGFVCHHKSGRCVAPPAPTPTATPPIPICCQCGSLTNLPRCFDTIFPEPCSPVGCVGNVGSFCGLDGLCHSSP